MAGEPNRPILMAKSAYQAQIAGVDVSEMELVSQLASLIEVGQSWCYRACILDSTETLRQLGDLHGRSAAVDRTSLFDPLTPQ
jgi:hypothetical protein